MPNLKKPQPSNNLLKEWTPEPQFWQFAELFDHLADVRAWIKDRDGRVRWVNSARLVFYFPDEPRDDRLLGKTVHELLPAFLADQFQLDDEYVLAGNRIVDRVEMHQRSDGTIGWHITNKVPLIGSDGIAFGIAGMTRSLDKTEQAVIDTAPFDSVLAYMRDHQGTRINNEQLARLAHMSVRACRRKFLDRFRLTPQAYLRMLRLRAASHELVYSEKPLSVVAASCGFADQSHFAREFRRHFGKTPREFRDHYLLNGPKEPNAPPIVDGSTGLNAGAK